MVGRFAVAGAERREIHVEIAHEAFDDGAAQAVLTVDGDALGDGQVSGGVPVTPSPAAGRP